MKEETLESYELIVDYVPVKIIIMRSEKEFVPIYKIEMPKIRKGTETLLKHIRESIVASYSIGRKDVLDVSKINELKKTFFKNIVGMISKEVPTLTEEQQQILAGTLIHDMLGLGDIEVLIADVNLEEIVINNAKEPVWVYHKKFGWLKSDIHLDNDEEIYNYSAKVGRGVGKDITTLSPLMDAHLMTGDRVNSTLFPISTKGNTITIRKFRRNPWTVTELISNNTLTPDVAAFLWIAVEYEISIIISGGTASGKSSFLAALLTFIPPNQRIVSIEETRELQLPKFLHWIPLSTRGSNPEGKGEVTMLDLLVNSLRMRPDRIIVGEVRRQEEAEVMFEAMHTGHSVYATVHADTAEQTTRRMTSPPINLPIEEIETLPLVAVMFRHRRKGIRRLFQIAEIISTNKDTNETQINILYRWRPNDDKIVGVSESIRLVNELRLHTGMESDDLERELVVRVKILNWMAKQGIFELNDVGKVISEFYFDRDKIINMAKNNASAKELLQHVKRFEMPKEIREGFSRDKTGRYACKTCGNRFDNHLKMRAHIKSKHTFSEKQVKNRKEGLANKKKTAKKHSEKRVKKTGIVKREESKKHKKVNERKKRIISKTKQNSEKTVIEAADSLLSEISKGGFRK